MLQPKQIVGRRLRQIGSTLAPTFIVGAPQEKQIRALDPSDVTSATLLAHARTPECIQMGSTLFGEGTNIRTVTVASATTLVGQAIGLVIDVVTAGLPGTGTARDSLDNGTTFGAPYTIPSGAGTHAVAGTDLTVTFQQAVSYAADNTYSAICPSFCDLVGAFPVSGNNFSNNGAAGIGTRPKIRTTGRLGVPCLRFDNGTQFLQCVGSAAAAFTGTNSAPYIALLCEVRALIGAGLVGTIWCASNLTDTDLPIHELSLQGTGQKLRCARRPDTGGAAATLDPNIIYFTGIYFLEDVLTGGVRKLRANTADLIAGFSGVSGAQSGLTITATTLTLGCRETQAGRTNFPTIDVYEVWIFDVEPSASDLLGMQLYLQR